MKRDAGYYWVRLASPDMPQHPRVWELVTFESGDRWLPPGDENEYLNSEVVVLSERLGPPEAAP